MNGLEVQAIAVQLGSATELVEGILAALANGGLASDINTGTYGSPAPGWALTKFGTRFLEWLKEGEEDPADT